MGKITGFLEFERQDRDYEPVEDRIKHWREFVLPLPETEVRTQAARCMDCGIPFCHDVGCPVNNQIPDWNDLVYRGDWREAARNLHSTNNFPEFTGRVCPAPCEASCTLNIDDDAGRPSRPSNARSSTAPWRRAGSCRSRRRARPARRSRSSAQGRPASPLRSSSRAPATRCTCSRNTPRVGGLMRYGIPDFKMEKHYIDRRVAQMEAEGVVFHYRRPCRRNDTRRAADRATSTPSCWPAAPRSRAICRCPAASSTASISRWSSCRSRTSAWPATSRADGDQPILATGKHVVVIGGGDTGSDCIGTSNRQGALSVTQLRDHAAAARAGEQAAHLALLADEAAHLVELARGGLRARLRGRDQALLGENGQRHRAARAWRRSTQRRVNAAKCPAPSSTLQGRPRAAGDGLRGPGARRDDRRSSASSSTRAATSRPTRDDYRTSIAEGLRLRRHAARPVAGRLGDPRRAARPRARSTSS